MNLITNSIEIYTEDFVVKVPGSITLGELDLELKKHSQETSLIGPKDYSLAKILSEDWGENNKKSILGMTVEHANGTITKTGSKVIKNVSGFDLAKLYIGSHNNYVRILDLYLRVNKLPEYQIECKYRFEKYPDEFFAALRRLNLTWDDLEVSCLSNPFTVSIIMKGEKEVLKLRKAKLKRYFGEPNEIIEKDYDGKVYDDVKERLEIFTKATQLNELAFLILSNFKNADIKIFPLINKINLYLNNVSYDDFLVSYESINEKLADINYYAHIYPPSKEGLVFTMKLNQHANLDELAILEKIRRVYV